MTFSAAMLSRLLPTTAFLSGLGSMLLVGAATAAPIVIPEANVRQMPKVTIATSANLLQNPSFERSIGGMLPEYWSRFGDLDRACPKSTVVQGGAFDGQWAARLAADETLRIPAEYARVPKDTFVLSAYVRLPEGAAVGSATCKLGLWAQVDVDDGRGHPGSWETSIVPTADWQRVVLPVIVDRVMEMNRWGIVGGLFEARITAKGGDVLVDAVQLEENTEATAFVNEITLTSGPVPEAPRMDELATVTSALQATPENTPAVLPASIELTVSLPEEGVCPRVATGGVPFAQGTLFHPGQVYLADANGEPVPVETSVLARWLTDGSVRSLYVALPIPVPAEGAPSPRYTLHYGEAKPADSADATQVGVSESDGVVTVTTGPLKFTVRRDGFGLFDGVWLDADSDGNFEELERVVDATAGGGCRVTDDTGKIWDSRHDRPVLVVERAGPVEAVIRAQGWHRDAEGHGLLGYIVRIHAYAGSANVWVEHTFENLTPPKSPSTLLRSIALDLPVPKTTEMVIGADGSRTLSAAGPVRVLQTVREGINGAGISHGGTDEWLPEELDGVFTFRTPAATVGLRIAEFADNYPMAVSARDTGPTIEFWPAGDIKLLALTHGVAKTHRFWLGFSGAGETPGLPAGPARVFPNPSDALGSGALIWGVAPERSTYGALETSANRYFRVTAVASDLASVVGKFNVGDSKSRAGFWLNNETAMPRAWLVQYLRTGERTFFDHGERAIRHTMDVDMDHVAGGQYVHNIHHALGNSGNNCHNYAEILSLYYMLSGDLLALDCARRNAVPCRKWVLKKWANGRAHGWPAWHVAEMCDVTGEKVNVDAALGIAKRYRGSIKVVDGKWESLAGKGGLLYGGTNLNALMRIHRATGDADAKSSFLEELDHVIEHVRGAGGWAFRGRLLMICEPLVYGWRLTGDRTYIELGMEGLLAGATACGGNDRDLALAAPLIAAAVELGIPPPATPTRRSWGFKRRHTMYILEQEDSALTFDYRRVETRGKTSEWWFKLHTPDGRLVKDETFEAMADTTGSFQIPPDDKIGVWKLEVHQGYPAMVDFAFNCPKAVLQIDPSMWRFSSSPELYSFAVPDDVSSFTIAACQYWGNGPSALVVYDPNGNATGEKRWVPPLEKGNRPWHEVTVDVPEEARGKTWSMLVAVGGQFRLRMDGIPPFVAKTAEELFVPPAWTHAPGR